MTALRLNGLGNIIGISILIFEGGLTDTCPLEQCSRTNVAHLRVTGQMSALWTVPNKMHSNDSTCTEVSTRTGCMIRSTSVVLWTIPILLLATTTGVEAQQPPYDVFPPADPPYYRVRYD